SCVPHVFSSASFPLTLRFFCLFLYAYRHLRALHSFPTRRSSDLLDLGVDGLRLDAVPYLVEREGTSSENLPETHAVLKRIRSVRSEEHTSELQSPDHLVCRLLLEKKKKTRQKIART